MARIGTLSLVLAALLASVADARHRPPAMTFHVAKTIAVDYWAKRGVKVTCDPRAIVHSYSDMSDEIARDKARGVSPYGYGMWADVATCSVEIPPWTDPLRRARDTAWIYCQEVVHEIGHIAGLEHSPTGVMAAKNGTVPRACSHPRRFMRNRPPTLRRDGFGLR